MFVAAEREASSRYIAIQIAGMGEKSKKDKKRKRSDTDGADVAAEPIDMLRSRCLIST